MHADHMSLAPKKISGTTSKTGNNFMKANQTEKSMPFGRSIIYFRLPNMKNMVKNLTLNIKRKTILLEIRYFKIN